MTLKTPYFNDAFLFLRKGIQNKSGIPLRSFATPAVRSLRRSHSASIHAGAETPICQGEKESIPLLTPMPLLRASRISIASFSRSHFLWRNSFRPGAVQRVSMVKQRGGDPGEKKDQWICQEAWEAREENRQCE